MNGQSLHRWSGARRIATLFGVLAGIGGLVHGIGEIMQGNVSPGSIFIPSWTSGPIATHLGGEPGITLVPNMLLAGVLTSLCSIVMIVWSMTGVVRPRGARVLILLALSLLLVGGGVGPPVIGLLAGVAATGSHRPTPAWVRRLPGRVRHGLAASWPWLFGGALASGSFLVMGSAILVGIFGFGIRVLRLGTADLFLNLFFATVGLLLLTLVATPAYDCERSLHQGRPDWPQQPLASTLPANGG